MFKTFNSFKALAVRNAQRAAAVGAMALASSAAFAQSTGVESLFDSVDLSGISAKILALGLLIVGIALILKGPSIVKRIIAKI